MSTVREKVVSFVWVTKKSLIFFDKIKIRRLIDAIRNVISFLRLKRVFLLKVLL